jgi:hypothetical protein
VIAPGAEHLPEAGERRLYPETTIWFGRSMPAATARPSIGRIGWPQPNDDGRPVPAAAVPFVH